MSRITMLEYGFVLLLSSLSGSVVSGAEETQAKSVVVTPFQPIVYGQRNDRLVIDCHVTSRSDILEYDWFKGGEKLLSNKRVYIASNGSLIFGKLVSKRRRNDTGRYECYATNKFGTVIGVQVDLRIQKQTAVVVPKNAEVEVGGVARFQCSVTPSASRSLYLWTFKDRAFESNVQNTRIFQKDGVLQIYNVTSSDEGLYNCAAFKQGDDLDLLEESAFLKIKSGPLTKESRLLNTPQNITVISQEPALLECLVQGQEPVIFSWKYPNGSTVVSNQHIQVTGLSNLQIPKTTQADAGVYNCIISHRNGSQTSHFYNLSIHVAPEFIKSPQLDNQNLGIAQRARLRCSADGHPTPNITWYKDGLRLFPPPGVKIGEELVLHGHNEDSGYYQCVADNSVKTVTATAYVYFKRKDDTPEEVKDVVAVALSPMEVSLTWSPAHTLDANPVVAYVIHYHELHDLECPGVCTYMYERQRGVSQKTTVIIGGLKPFTMYSFGVQGFSPRGAGVLSKAVVVRTAESIPSGSPIVQISPDSPTSFRISWSELPKSQRNGIITQYKVSIEFGITRTVIKLPGDQLQYLATGLEQGQPYKIQVLAGTAVGFGVDNDNWISYSTPKVVSGDIPTPVLDFQPINSSSVLISWSITNTNIGSYRIMVKELLGSVSVREYNLSGMETKCVVTGLKNRTYYEVDFLAKSRKTDAVKSVKELYQSLNPGDFPEPPPPMSIMPEPLSSTRIKLVWEQPKSSMAILRYTVRYQQRIAEEMVNREDMSQFFNVDDVKAMLNNLQPYTWYFISVQSHTENTGGPYSRPVLVQTLEGIPSPPENVLAEVVSPGTVKLKWGPPSQQNGVITYYIIYYNADKNVPDNSWTSIQQNGSATSVVVEDLKSKVYYFKLRACTNAGEGDSTDIIEINTLNCDGKECPICEPPQSCVPSSKDHETLTTLFEQKLGIVIGCAVGLVCIIICSVFVIVKHRQLRARYRQNANVHLMNTSNGQNVGLYLSQQPVGQTTVVDNSYSPILHRLPENEDSDSKGGGEMVTDRRHSRLSSHNGLPRSIFSRPHDDSGSEHRALLSGGTSSSSQSNETSEESTPDTGMLDSNGTSPEGDFEIYCNKISRNQDGTVHEEVNEKDKSSPPTKKHLENDLGHMGTRSISVMSEDDTHVENSDDIRNRVDTDKQCVDSSTMSYGQTPSSGIPPHH